MSVIALFWPKAQTPQRYACWVTEAVYANMSNNIDELVPEVEMTTRRDIIICPWEKPKFMGDGVINKGGSMMRRLAILCGCVLALLFSLPANAILSMELTRGVAGAIPIAIVPFADQDTAPQLIGQIVANDLSNSGRFKVFGREQLAQFPTTRSAVTTSYFRKLGTDNVVIGQVKSLGDGRYQINFQLLDILNGEQPSVLLNKEYTVKANLLRSAAHHISDLIYEQITGTPGVFSTKLAYVVVSRQAQPNATRYILEVSDQDGYNPRPLLNSPEPIMSPSWSPSGRQIAYVSFEKHHAGIYLQDVATGARRMLSDFPGINGAPAWSPDGKKLAVVLSKNGAPNIYLMDIATHQLTQLTNDFYINTEPAFAPDGKSLLFTSNRSGGSHPQIYQINLATRAVTRLTYDGDYNARGSFSADGKQIAMIHRVNGVYKIALLDLTNGITRVLTNSAGDSASPSMAPNSSMILYDTYAGGRNTLGMVSSDGRIQLVLPARNGEAQDPAWSPFAG